MQLYWQEHGQPNPSGRRPGRRPGSIRWNKGTRGVMVAHNKGVWHDRICATCQKAFSVPDRLAKRGVGVHWSMACLGASKKKVRGPDHPLYTLVERVCRWCEQTFLAKPAVVAYGWAIYCSRSRLGSATVARSWQETSIETLVRLALEKIGEPFQPQHRLGPWLVDFYLPGRKLVIECDGAYWHAMPQVMRRDRKKDGWLRHNGYQVVRLSEPDIHADAMGVVRAAL